MSGHPGPDVCGCGADNPSLRDLRRQVDDVAVDHFVADFLELLDDRLSGLDDLLRRDHNEDAITALLSIETSALMVGANQLAATAAILRRALAQHELARVRGLFDQLVLASVHTKQMLSAH